MLSPRLTALWKAIQAGNKVTLRDVDVDLLSEHFDGLDTDWTSPGGDYHVQTQYDHSNGSRTYLAYRLWCRGKLVFQGNDYGCSPLHAGDSCDALAGLLHCLSLRPGDTDREYFDAYTPEQMAFAQEHGESLGMWAEEMAARDENPPA